MSNWTGTVPTILAGYAPTGDDWNQILTFMTAATDAWTDQSGTFAIQAVSVNPTMGNSTVVSRYKQIGKTVYFGFSVTIGSTYAAGTGNYKIPLPVTPLTPATVHVGRVYVQKVGTGLYTGSLLFNSPTDTFCSVILQNTTGALLSSTGPGVAWGTGDLFQGSIVYDAA